MKPKKGHPQEIFVNYMGTASACTDLIGGETFLVSLGLPCAIAHCR